MVTQSGAQAVQRHRDVVFRHPETAGDLGNAVEIPVSADEDAALVYGQAAEKGVDGADQLPPAELLLHAVAAGDELSELVERGGIFPAAALCRRAARMPVDGQVSRDLPEEGREYR